MKTLEIDGARCTGCGRCEKACVSNLFAPDSENNGKMSFENRHNWCMGCGHCVAVCPAGAIRYELETDREAERISTTELPSSDSLLELLQRKRSIRNFAEDQLDDAKIATIMEALRYAPSGHNNQGCEYLLISDRDVINDLTESILKNFAAFSKILKVRWLLKPFVSSAIYTVLSDPGLLPGIRSMIKQWKEGENPIFHNAPHVLIATYPNMGGLSLIDPTIALTYGMLVADRLGVGSCWMGFAIQTFMKNKKVKKMLGISKERLIAGVITLGIPEVQYQGIPPRKEAVLRKVG